MIVIFVWKDIFGRCLLLKLRKDLYQFTVKWDFPPSFRATAFLSRLEHDPPFFKIHVTPGYVPAGADPTHGIFHKKQMGLLVGRGDLQHLEEIGYGGIYFGVSSCGKGGRYLIGLSVMRLFFIPRLNIALRIFLYSFRVAGFFLRFRSKRIL